jgi:mRNA interferase RelE/StbE
VSDADYVVELAPAAARQLRKLPPNETARLRAPILALGQDPRPVGAMALAGTPFLRLRIGDVRVVYHVDDVKRRIVVLRVARRAESTYRRVR